MAERFVTSRIVEFHDTDMAGIMHFASFFHYMESVEHELLRSLGLSIYTTVDGVALSFPRVSVSCNFRSPAKCEDQLDFSVGIAHLGNTSVTYDFEIQSSGREIAQGTMTAVCCRVGVDMPPEPVRIPEELRSKLRKFATDV